MPFTVTTHRRGGAEHTNLVHTEGAAMSLALMMRRASDEYCCESMVTVCDVSGYVVAAWRGGLLGWQALASSAREAGARDRASRPAPRLAPLTTPVGAHAPLQPRAPRAVSSGRFVSVPTEPLQSSPSISIITEHSAV
jgi:hypothetical protein